MRTPPVIDRRVRWSDSRRAAGDSALSPRKHTTNCRRAQASASGTTRSAASKFDTVARLWILHLDAALLVDEAGVQVQHVPYKGSAPLIADLIGGQVDMAVIAVPAIQSYLKSQAMVAVGIGSATRSPTLADVPTIAEQGLANCVIDGWFGVIGPARMAAADVGRIHDALVTAMAVPEVREALLKQGNVIAPTTPEVAAAFFRSEKGKYEKIVRSAGATVT